MHEPDPSRTIQRHLSHSERRASVVTHTLKSVRKHHIDVKLPPTPDADAEAFVVTLNGQGVPWTFEVSPRDMQQVVAVLTQSLSTATGGQLA